MPNKIVIDWDDGTDYESDLLVVTRELRDNFLVENMGHTLTFRLRKGVMEVYRAPGSGTRTGIHGDYDIAVEFMTTTAQGRLIYFTCDTCKPEDWEVSGHDNVARRWCPHLHEFFQEKYDRVMWPTLPTVEGESCMLSIPMVPDVGSFAYVTVNPNGVVLMNSAIMGVQSSFLLGMDRPIGRVPLYTTINSMRHLLWNAALEEFSDLNRVRRCNECDIQVSPNTSDHNRWLISQHNICYKCARVTWDDKVAELKRLQDEKITNEQRAEELKRLFADATPNVGQSPKTMEQLHKEQAKVKAREKSLFRQQAEAGVYGPASEGISRKPVTPRAPRNPAQLPGNFKTPTIRKYNAPPAPTPEPAPEGVEATYGDDFPVPKPEQTISVTYNAATVAPNELQMMQEKLRKMGM